MTGTSPEDYNKIAKSIYVIENLSYNETQEVEEIKQIEDLKKKIKDITEPEIPELQESTEKESQFDKNGYDIFKLTTDYKKPAVQDKQHKNIMQQIHTALSNKDKLPEKFGSYNNILAYFIVFYSELPYLDKFNKGPKGRRKILAPRAAKI